jgi:hypothetical protein
MPAWKNAALFYAGPWGQVIADSVRVKRDRVPAVQIGGNRKVLSGGGTATMVRAHRISASLENGMQNPKRNAHSPHLRKQNGSRKSAPTNRERSKNGPKP